MKRALEAPARQIAENSAVDGGVVVARMMSEPGQFRLRRRAQGICRPGRGRHRRSGQGGSYRIGKRGFGRQRAAAYRSDDDGNSGDEERTAGRAGDGNVSARYGCQITMGGSWDNMPSAMTFFPRVAERADCPSSSWRDFTAARTCFARLHWAPASWRWVTIALRLRSLGARACKASMTSGMTGSW